MFENNKLSEDIRSQIERYIAQRYVEIFPVATYGVVGGAPTDKSRRQKKTATAKALSSAPAPMAARTLEDALKEEDMGFSEALLRLIDETGKKDSEIYKKANLSKQHFSKIRNNPAYKPTKPTAIALALALELDMEATKELIGRAGYALTNSSKFDLIVQYFIEQKNYNIVEINIALYEFDQNLLGV